MDNEGITGNRSASFSGVETEERGKKVSCDGEEVTGDTVPGSKYDLQSGHPDHRALFVGLL